MNVNSLFRELPKLACLRQCLRHKYYDKKWSALRRAKVVKIELPDYDKLLRQSKLSAEEQRSLLKKEGIMPPRHFSERPILMASTSTIFEPYVPPEGDGVASKLSGVGAKQRFKELEMKGKSMLQLRKIKQFEEDFDPKTFPSTALDIYKEAFHLVQNYEKNEPRLHELMTEKAYPEVIWKLNKKTFRWNFLESIEAPRVVHIRTQEMMSKDNLYAQVTVRFNSKLLVSIYDRFGRLSFGSENHPFEMVEYVVFEKHLANEYSQWRIHGKVIPEWSSKKDDFSIAPLRTYVKPRLEAIEPKQLESKGSEQNTEELAAA